MYLRYLQYLHAVIDQGSFALAAKACGVRVNEFAIGMGPALFKKTRGDTTYALRLLPIGGFCAMEGEEEDSSDPAALNNQGFWRKLLIFAAGALITGLAVAAGAFGAHALKSILDPAMLAVYETAARYQMYHALGLFVVAWLCRETESPSAVKAGWLFCAGILRFSGSL